jgi:hypothetical protein
VDATRLIQAAIKNRDIELRTVATKPDDDVMVMEVLQKMIKQRRESIDMYDKGGRPELAACRAREGRGHRTVPAAADVGSGRRGRRSTRSRASSAPPP